MVHIGDNSQLNELSTVMAEEYKKNQQSKKYTRWTRSMRTDNMQEFEPIYYFFSMKDGGVKIVVHYISVHAYIGFWDAWVTTHYIQLQRSYNGSEVQPPR